MTQVRQKKQIIRNNIILSMIAVAVIWSGLSICYQDLAVSSQFGLTFIDSILDGEPLSFYGKALLAGFNEEGANYGILFYLIYGIWDIPIWLLNRFCGIAPDAAGCLIWYKLLLILALVWSVNEITTLASFPGYCGKKDQSINEEQKRFAFKSEQSCQSLWYLTAPAIFFPVLIACQSDILMVCFMLRGIRYYLQKDYRKFLLFMAVSINMKPFPVFVLIVLILMKEKRILPIFRDFLIGFSLFLLNRVAYYFSPSYPDARQLSKGESIDAFLLSVGQWKLPVFIIAAAVLFWYLWRHYRKDPAENPADVFLYSFAIMAAFCCFGDVAPYWIIYYVPFAALLIYRNPTGRMMLLDTVGQICLVMFHVMKQPWVYGGSKTYTYLLLKPLFGPLFHEDDVPTLAGSLSSFHLNFLTPFYLVVAIGCNAAVFFLCFRRQQGGRTEQTDAERPFFFFCFLRLLFIYGFLAFTLLALKVSAGS